ncbi:MULTISPECIES: outer membrane protein assembly factor BamA [unclassified Pseudodesulfovibrio]|uniref:outer membrane protein assembly factor BamA n=1 Tax=unclassified Pseudodesulfovibrio TaxID=2661612 RepID=UPI000FEBA34E|nr:MULTISPECIES: outer membrane protein assembly factor BamA [unclassified Pseudodesulfovibrio]MCJ2163991.1 outer membrane protein assembly factor BamA [Pseudodesulfovibrio sp. S3-i]RWU05369.1 outer membrane protein assembly factor BamA [Pseudodesulfovibrio sp. S3]
MLINLVRKFAIGVIVTVILGSAGAVFASDDLTQDVSVAVLPFEVNAGDDLSYLKDSLPELLTDRLREAGFKVIEPEEIRRLVGEKGITQFEPKSARELALLSGAEFSVYGSLNQLGDNLTLDARLIDAYANTPGKKISVTKEGLINLLPAVDALVDRMRMDLLRLDIVSEIDVEGTKVLDKEVILMRMTMQKGDMITAKSVNTALKNIYDLGYFDDVTVKVDSVEDGKKVILVVKEKPRIQALGVTGAKEIDSEDILEAVSTKKGGVVNPKVLSDDIRVIREMYRKEGYYKAKVTHEIQEAGTGIARLTFVIDEGPQLYIENVIIDGAKELDPDDIKEVLALKERGMFSWINDSGVLKEELLERDASAIMAFYQSKGFLTARVGQPEVDIKDDGIDVIYKVWEGDRYKMGNTLFQGDLIDDQAKLLEVTDIDRLKEEDEYFDRLILRKDVAALTSYYNDYGYAYADVGVKLQDDAETKVVDVVYTISKHQRVHIRRVLIEGNTVTRDNVIMREMRLADGDQFSGEKLKRSSQRLTHLDFFEKVDIAPVPTGNPEEMDLIVKVKDKSTGKISGGVGYSTYDGVFFGGEVSEKNLFGRGYETGFNGQIGGSTNKYVIYFTNPHINDTDLGFGVNIFKKELEYNQYDLDSTGINTNFFYPIGEYTKLKWNYGLESYEIKNVDSNASQKVKTDEGSHLSSTVSGIVTRDTRDDFTSTTEGTKTNLTVTFGGGPLGGTDDFIKYTGTFEWWTPVLEQVVFHSKFWVGYLHENYGGGDIPAAQRFELGGVGTVRGYSNYDITPTESSTSTSTLGGDKAFYTNIELKRPLSKELGIVALTFFDAGNSWKEGEMFFESATRYGTKPSFGLYKSVGAGLNWYSPVGPVGFVYAYALDDLDGGSRHKVELMMGQQF